METSRVMENRFADSKVGVRAHLELQSQITHKRMLKTNFTARKKFASNAEDGRSTSVFSLYWQISLGQMVNFPAFIASKYFDL